MLRAPRVLFALALTSAALAGCVTPGAGVDPAGVRLPAVDGVLPIRIDDVMTFTQSVVGPAVGIAADLYEPTMEVSDTGTSTSRGTSSRP